MEAISGIIVFVVVIAIIGVLAWVIQQAVGFVLGFAWVALAVFLLFLFWIPAPLEPYLGFIQTNVRAPFEFVFERVSELYRTTFSFL